MRGVIVAHPHEDHAGTVELVAAHGLPLWMAPLTQRLVASVPPAGSYRRMTWNAMPPLPSAVLPLDPSPPEVLAAPGHSADHHVVRDPRTHTLFAGDLFLRVAVRIAHDDEDLWASIASLERLAALEPVRMFCAHHGLVPEPAAALRAKAAWTRRMIDTVQAAAAFGATATSSPSVRRRSTLSFGKRCGHGRRAPVRR